MKPDSSKSSPVVDAFNRGFAVADAYQINNHLYWMTEDLVEAIQPEAVDSQPVITSPECDLEISAGDVRGGTLDGEVIVTAAGHTISFLTDLRIS